MRHPSRLNKKSGFVLILVLGVLLLISVLVIGFLGHASSQRRSAASYRDQTGTLLLSDVTVNMVKSQIDTAIMGNQNTGAGTPNLWASQPGAIRTVNSAGAQTTYKLYSSNALTDTNVGSNLKADILGDIPTSADAGDWSGSGLWTDLNAPAKRADGTNAYPIIDVVNDTLDLPAGGTSTAPFATGSFNVDTSGTNPIGATRSAGNSSTPLPMPVRWLYVLKQGQIIAPDTTSTSTALTFKQASTQPISTPLNPATDNPIVGRIAFWTDDDTCRVNINTASYGTFWDIPRFTSTDDYVFSNIQPVNKEFQRYPGHAAMTTLSLALPEFAPNGSPTLGAGGTAEELIGLTPRYYTGGSTEGTVQTSAGIGATAKTNRLYQSVDELLFDPPPASTTSTSRTASAYLTKNQVEAAKFFLTAHSRAPELNLYGEPRVSMWPISSLNNGGGDVYRTPTDQFLALSSTTPGGTTAAPYAYYFTRAPFKPSPGSNSSTADVNLARNVQLLTYLDNLTSQAIPGNLGGGATFDSKYQQLGMRQILTEIFDYIRITNARDPNLDPAVTSGGVPYAAAGSINGVAGAFGDGQILPTYYAPWGTYGFGRFSGRIIEAALVFVGVGKGIPATTTVYNSTTNPPNYDPVPATQAATSGYVGVTPAPAGTGSTLIPPPGCTAVQAMLALNFFDPALGWSPANPNFTITVSGLSTLTLGSAASPGGNGLNFVDGYPEQISNILNGLNSLTMESQIDNERPGDLGSIMDFRLMQDKRILYQSKSLNSQWFPFYSRIVNVPNASGTAVLSGGGLVTINVYAATATGPPAIPIHTYTFDFSKLNGNMVIPNFSFRPMFGSSRIVPTTGGGVAEASPNPPVTWPPTPANTTDRFDDWNTHGEDANGEQIDFSIDSFNDTVLSLVPTSTYGDYRMLAPYSLALAKSSALLAGTAFQAHPNVNFGATPNRLAYGFEYGGGQFWRLSTQGTLVKVSPPYWVGASSGVNAGSWTSIPLVPATVNNPSSGVTSAPPDFDNGFGDLPDGAYINKPDEGVVYPVPNQLGSDNAQAQPYYDNRQETSQTNPQNFFSSQRQVPSPVMFGSLPTGAPVGSLPAQPWQTLLFQPGATGHFGLNAPKDEYLLDLFWMPQAEPYAISEPFSTAGKINLNYQILPFTYIDRSTAIQSVLSTEKVAMVSSSKAASYKQFGESPFGNARFALNLSEVDGTLRDFVQRFSTLDFFKSPAEICDVFLVPQGQSWTSDATAQSTFYGPSFALVGDNTREKPYADIYSRITTKSNTFTVYYRVQALRNPPGVNAAQWTEGQGVVLGDYRGSTSLERYIDPNDTTLPDYATVMAGTPNLETHYKWRVVNNARFAP